MFGKKGEMSGATIAFWLAIIIFILGLALVFTQFNTFKSLVSP